jgi:hypothetical protein
MDSSITKHVFLKLPPNYVKNRITVLKEYIVCVAHVNAILLSPSFLIAVISLLVPSRGDKVGGTFLSPYSVYTIF